MDYNDKFLIMNEIFNKSFVTSYKKIKLKGKTQLLKYILSFYRRWYYSAIIEDTILSPANLFNTLNKEYDLHKNALPFPSTGSFNKLSQFKHQIKEISLEHHPIVTDLKIFLDSCAIDFELTDLDMVTTEHENSLLSELSMPDPFYVEYLTVLSVHMNLIKKIPSIYSNRAQVTPEYDKLYSLSDREILDKIILAATHVVSSFVNEMIPIKKIIDSDYIFSILKEPITTDDFFKNLYMSIGINLDHLLDYQPDNLSDEIYDSMVSSTFYLGVIIDKYFYTPFGYYLNLINPGYLLPYDMDKEMDYALEAVNETEDVSVAMFSPCSHYTLTCLGQEYFHVTNEKNKNIGSREAISFDTMLALIDRQTAVSAPLDESYEDFLVNNHIYKDSDKVYEIKIRMNNMTILWKNMEFLEASTLHDLYLEVCYEFNFDVNMKYSIFADTSENAFSEYTSPNKKRRLKKADQMNFKALSFPLGHKFLLVLHDVVSPYDPKSIPLPVKSVKFLLEVKKIKDKDINKLYPRVSSESQFSKEIELDWFV